MLSLLTAPAAGKWTSGSGVFPASEAGPSLTPASDAVSEAAFAVLVAHVAASAAAVAALATLFGSAALAAAEAVAASHACFFRSFARSTVACVVIACVSGASPGPSGVPWARALPAPIVPSRIVAPSNDPTTLFLRPSMQFPLLRPKN